MPFDKDNFLERTKQTHPAKFREAVGWMLFILTSLHIKDYINKFN